jgi:hypothetical protein
MNMKHWWNNNWQMKTEVLRENTAHPIAILSITNTKLYYPGIEPQPPL